MAFVVQYLIAIVHEATIVYIRISNLRIYSLNVDQSNAGENIEYDGKLKKVFVW